MSHIGIDYRVSEANPADQTPPSGGPLNEEGILL